MVVGGSTQGCAEGSSGVQTLRSPQGHQSWVKKCLLPFPCTTMSWEDPSPWHVPLSSPLGAPGPPHCPPALPGSGGEMECCLFSPSGPAVGYLFVVYPGNTQFQRNHQNFGARRQKAAARNRWRGSTGIRLCLVPVAAPLGRHFPISTGSSPGCCLRDADASASQHHHPGITIPGFPSLDHCKRGYNRTRERFFWAAAPAQLQQGIHIRQKGKIGSGMVWVQTEPAQSWGPPALGRFSTPASPSPGGLGAQKWVRGVELEQNKSPDPFWEKAESQWSLGRQEQRKLTISSV